MKSWELNITCNKHIPLSSISNNKKKKERELTLNQDPHEKSFGPCAWVLQLPRFQLSHSKSLNCPRRPSIPSPITNLLITITPSNKTLNSIQSNQNKTRIQEIKLTYGSFQQKPCPFSCKNRSRVNKSTKMELQSTHWDLRCWETGEDRSAPGGDERHVNARDRIRRPKECDISKEGRWQTEACRVGTAGFRSIGTRKCDWNRSKRERLSSHFRNPSYVGGVLFRTDSEREREIDFRKLELSG